MTFWKVPKWLNFTTLLFTMVEENFEIWHSKKLHNGSILLLSINLVVENWDYVWRKWLKKIEIMINQKNNFFAMKILFGWLFVKRETKRRPFWPKVSLGDQSLLKETYLGTLKTSHIKISECTALLDDGEGYFLIDMQKTWPCIWKLGSEFR